MPDETIVSSTLMCNPTWMPPNQVSYLKGSSMESFTLGPTPKSISIKVAISNVSPNNREISQNPSCIELSIVSPKQHLSKTLSKSVAHLFSRHSFYIILFHFSRFFHFPPAFHFLCIFSLAMCDFFTESAISSSVLCNFDGDSSSPLHQRFLIARSSSVVASVLLSLSLPLSLCCLGAWGLVQRGMGLWLGLVQKGMGFSFYPHLQLDSFNFWIWYVLKSLGFDDLEQSLFVSYEFVDVSLYGFLRLSFICLLW